MGADGSGAPVGAVAPELEYAFTWDAVATPVHNVGTQMVWNVTSIDMHGPDIKGSSVSPAGDWITIMPNGVWYLDVRFSVLLDDGSHAYCHYNGIGDMTPEQIETIQAGGTIPGDAMYFYSTPYFQTDSEKHAWLGRHVFLGCMREFGSGKVIYDVFKVTGGAS